MGASRPPSCMNPGGIQVGESPCNKLLKKRVNGWREDRLYASKRRWSGAPKDEKEASSTTTLSMNAVLALS